MTSKACCPKHTWQVPPLCSAYSLLADRRAAQGWQAPSLWAVWNCPWGMWDFQKLCYTQTPLTALSRCTYPMALCFLHTSFLSTADQGSLNITKAGVLTAPIQGGLLSSTSLVVFKKCWIATTPSGYCLWFPPGSELSTLEEWSLLHRRLLSAKSNSAQSINWLLSSSCWTPHSKLRTVVVRPCSGEGEGPGKRKSQRSFLGTRIIRPFRLRPRVLLTEVHC